MNSRIGARPGYIVKFPVKGLSALKDPELETTQYTFAQTVNP